MINTSLKSKRILEGLTQDDLGKKVGVSRQTIISIESGKYVPSTELALKLAKALQQKVEDLFWLSEER